MSSTTVTLPQSQIIELLKALPQEQVFEIFNKVIISYDNSPLTKSENNRIAEAIAEYNTGELVDWKDIK